MAEVPKPTPSEKSQSVTSTEEGLIQLTLGRGHINISTPTHNVSLLAANKSREAATSEDLTPKQQVIEDALADMYEGLSLVAEALRDLATLYYIAPGKINLGKPAYDAERETQIIRKQGEIVEMVGGDQEFGEKETKRLAEKSRRMQIRLGVEDNNPDPDVPEKR